jgi:pSer/pThr/pTyr-binding forkhead associated (FHA) protein
MRQLRSSFASQVLPESFALMKQETMIGRDPACDVHLAWDGMSRNHAWIKGEGGDINMKSPSGTPIPSSFKIIDGGGVNGTYLNGVRVSRYLAESLHTSLCGIWGSVSMTRWRSR